MMTGDFMLKIEFLKIQDERLRLIENNTSDLVKLSQSVEDVQKEIQGISKGKKNEGFYL